MENTKTYTVFEGHTILMQGNLSQVVVKVKKYLGVTTNSSVLIFSDETGKTIDFNFHGTEQDILKRLDVFVGPIKENEITGPGRPKLGVVSREVSLLPRHWEWLATQPGGASATLRQLVEAAKKKSTDNYSDKQLQERTYRFMSVLAGDLAGYEEALRALYKKDKKSFVEHIQNWPKDIKTYLFLLSKQIFY